MRVSSNFLILVSIALMMGVACDATFASDVRRAEREELTFLNVTIYPKSHKTIILKDPRSPVDIKSAKTLHIDVDQRSVLEISLPSRSWSLIPDGPLVEIDAISKGVVAAKFGVVFFDSFNERAGGFTGVYTEPPKHGMRWTGRVNSAWLSFGIACVFVRAARLEDGRVWKADMKKIAIMMIAEGCSTQGEGGTLKHLNDLNGIGKRL